MERRTPRLTLTDTLFPYPTLVRSLTNRDVRFAENPKQPVAELMTSQNLAVVPAGVTSEEARRLLHQRRIEKLLVVDDQYHCVGLITVKDIEKRSEEHTSELQSLMRISYAVFCLKKKINQTNT